MDDSLNLLNDWLAKKQKTGDFSVPADARPLHISVASADEKFEPDFLRGLYVLEQAMLEKGLEPDAFFIEKHLLTLPAFGKGVPAYIYEYKISFHDNSYSVRRETDMDFLAYFSTLCLCDEHEDFNEPHAQSKSFFSKLVGWLEADAFPKPAKAD